MFRRNIRRATEMWINGYKKYYYTILPLARNIAFARCLCFSNINLVRPLFSFMRFVSFCVCLCSTVRLSAFSIKSLFVFFHLIFFFEFVLSIVCRKPCKFTFYVFFLLFCFTSIFGIDDHLVLKHRLQCKPFKWC
uniref:Uncharacterized protein n=1 Tax=Glossina palpalis gambiensis TaxID=67801 RepID=A0A1B0AXL4_9MUSC